MIRHHKAAVLASFLILVCLSLMGGVLLLKGHLRTLQDEWDDLGQREADLTASIVSLVERKGDLIGALEELKKFSFPPASDEMAFYASVQKPPRDNGMEILSIQWVKPRGNQTDVRAIAMLLRGDYYGMAQTLADWRNLPVAARITGLTLRRPDRGGPGQIEMEATLEAIVEHE